MDAIGRAPWLEYIAADQKVICSILPLLLWIKGVNKNMIHVLFMCAHEGELPSVAKSS